MIQYRNNITFGWLAACGLYCLFVQPACAADKAAGPPKETMEQVKSLSDQVRSSVSGFVDELARGYIGTILRADQELDALNITKPDHRFYLLEKPSYDFIDTTLAQYDAFAAEMKRDWLTTPPAFRVAIRKLLENERARLETFLRADPVIIRSVINPMYADGTLAFMSAETILRDVREAGGKADAGPGFTSRLRRAARVSDAEVRRVVTEKARKTASDLADTMADNYVKFLITANKVLDKHNVKDTVARAYSMAEQNHVIITAFLEEYDRFSKAMTESFKGSGAVIEKAVAEAVAAERTRIDSFLNTDPVDLRTAYTLPKGKTLGGADLRRQLELAKEIAAEEKAGFRRFKNK